MVRICENKLKCENIPIYLTFYVLPIISFFSQIIFKIHPNYEIIGIVLFPTFIIISRKHHLPRWLFFLLIIIISFTILKYILPLLWIRPIVFRAWLLDIKWIYYLVIAILWTGLVGEISIQSLCKGGRFFAIFYIASIVIKTFTSGSVGRFNSALVGECNYDCFLILIPFAFISANNREKWDYLLFGMAALMSTSKTGIISFIALLLYPKYKKSKYKLYYIIIGIFISALWIYIYFFNRGVENLDEIDRAIFFMQYFEYLRNCQFINIILGYFPGTPMNIDIINEFSWYIFEFETINDIKGCYPFYFHSTYIRLAIVWGLPFVIGLTAWLIYKCKTCEYAPLENLIIVLLLESISLSSLSLVNVSFIFFLSFLKAYSEYLSIRKSTHNNKI